MLTITDMMTIQMFEVMEGTKNLSHCEILLV